MICALEQFTEHCYVSTNERGFRLRQKLRTPQASMPINSTCTLAVKRSSKINAYGV